MRARKYLLRLTSLEQDLIDDEVLDAQEVSERVSTLRSVLEAAIKTSPAQSQQESRNIIETNKALDFIKKEGERRGRRGCEEEVKKQDCKLIINVGGVSGDIDADDDDAEEDFEDFLGNMLSVKPTQLTNEEGEELLYKEAKRREVVAKQLTNVFSSANQMTRSLMSSATTTTLNVKQTFDNVRNMQKYNEEKEAEIERAAKALDLARLQRLEEDKVAKGKCVIDYASKLMLFECVESRDKRVTDRSNKFFTKMAKGKYSSRTKPFFANEHFYTITEL